MACLCSKSSDAMRLEILGCSGGIGDGQRTTSMWLDRDILIDAGTGAADLTLDNLAGIDHVFLTHSHLDHVCSIPFMVDAVGAIRDKPLTVYALQATLDALRQHVLNDVIWPDFTRIPSSTAPYLRYQAISVGETVTLGGRSITALPAYHVVPALGYQLDSGKASLVFSGDTAGDDAFWQAVNRIGNLRYLIIETSFRNSEKQLALASRHLCPATLASELQKFTGVAEIHITHLKPGEVDAIMGEIGVAAAAFQPQCLYNHQMFEF